MALILKTDETFNSDQGISLSEAYLVIDSVRVDKANNSLNADFEVYADQQARIDRKQHVTTCGFSVQNIDPSANIYMQAYLYLAGLESMESWESDE